MSFLPTFLEESDPNYHYYYYFCNKAVVNSREIAMRTAIKRKVRLDDTSSFGQQTGHYIYIASLGISQWITKR